jgi:hypothetical protein
MILCSVKKNDRVYSLIFNLIPPILNLYFVGARNFVIFTKTIKIGTHPKINQSLVMIVLFIKYKYMHVKSSLNNQILGAKYGAFRNLNNTTILHMYKVNAYCDILMEFSCNIILMNSALRHC